MGMQKKKRKRRVKRNVAEQLNEGDIEINYQRIEKENIAE